LKFTPTPLAGAWLIDLEPRTDERGLFARTVCQEEFARHGLNAAFVQQSVSWNPTAGTLRGLHFQMPPFGEDKLVRVTRGSVFDVIADIRPDSATFGRCFSIELSADNRRQIYIPKGFAHGFLSLEPDTEVFYQMTTSYQPDAALGIRWDDPALSIAWPTTANLLIGDNDRKLPLLASATVAAALGKNR